VPMRLATMTRERLLAVGADDVDGSTVGTDTGALRGRGRGPGGRRRPGA
jgi:hypothetical protein